jgi:hypothetical protein
MINKAILPNFTSSQFQAALWVKQEKQTTSKSEVVLKSTVFYCYVSIVLQEYHSSLKSKILFKKTVFCLYYGALLHIDDASLETRISYKLAIDDQSFGILEFAIDNSTPSKAIVLNEFTIFYFHLRVLGDMNHCICPSSVIINLCIVESDLLKHRKCLSFLWDHL